MFVRSSHCTPVGFRKMNTCTCSRMTVTKKLHRDKKKDSDAELVNDRPLRKRTLIHITITLTLKNSRTLRKIRRMSTSAHPLPLESVILVSTRKLIARDRSQSTNDALEMARLQVKFCNASTQVRLQSETREKRFATTSTSPIFKSKGDGWRSSAVDLHAMKDQRLLKDKLLPTNAAHVGTRM